MPHRAVQCNAVQSIISQCVCRHLVERSEGDAHTAAVDERLGRPGPLGMVQRENSTIHAQALAPAPPS